MKNKNKCPVCNCVLVEIYLDVICEGTLAELEEECPNKCYCYDFAYGVSREFVFGNELKVTEDYLVFDWCI